MSTLLLTELPKLELFPGIIIAIIGISAIFLCVRVFFYWLGEIGKKQLAREKAYESLHQSIQTSIDTLGVTPENYDRIMKDFDALCEIKCENSNEKTSVLFGEFMRKFAVVRKKRHLEDERIIRRSKNWGKQAFGQELSIVEPK